MRRRARSRRISAAGGNRTMPRTRTKATGPRQAGLYKSRVSADEDLVALLETQLRCRTGRQLDHAASPPNEPHHAIPGWELREDLLHALLLIEEHGVDREAHEQHMDAAALARVDPHPASGSQRSTKHEADAAADERERDLELIGNHFAGSLMHRARTFHLNGVAYLRGWSSTATECACITSSMVPRPGRRWCWCTASLPSISSTGWARDGRRRWSTRAIVWSASTVVAMARPTNRMTRLRTRSG